MAKKRSKKIEEKEEKIADKTPPIKKEKIEKAIELEGKKKLDVLKEEEESGRKIAIYLLLIFAVMFVTGFAIYMILFSAGNQPIKKGDTVQIIYTVKYENGSIFDSGNFTFDVGSGEVIDGVDEGIIGMKIGESKTIVVPPEKGYGNYDEMKIIEIPRMQTFNRTEKLSVEQFNLTFQVEPELNKVYKLEGMNWPVRVVTIENDTVIVRHEPEDQMEYPMKDSLGNVYGIAKIMVTDENLTINITPIKNSKIYTIVGIGKIIDFNETDMKIDFNHELAGKTLVFDIKVLNVIHR
jgi:peptidylprolyl isomerase